LGWPHHIPGGARFVMPLYYRPIDARKLAMKHTALAVLGVLVFVGYIVAIVWLFSSTIPLPRGH
jgi:hypothetical protein